MKSRTCSGEATISSRKPATCIPRYKHDRNRINSRLVTASYYKFVTVNSTVPQDFHESAVFGAQEPTNHLFPHCRSPYTTSVKETLDPHPNVQKRIITFT